MSALEIAGLHLDAAYWRAEAARLNALIIAQGGGQGNLNKAVALEEADGVADVAQANLVGAQEAYLRVLCDMTESDPSAIRERLERCL